MLKTILEVYKLRSNCIITIYMNNMSTKAKGHTSSKSTSKSDIPIRSNPINTLKKIKNGKNSKKIFHEDSSKSSKVVNTSTAKDRKNNLKIFSLIDSRTLANPPVCEKEVKINCPAAEPAHGDNTCNSINYAKIMAAATTSDRSMHNMFNYNKYNEDCQSEMERLRGIRKWSNTELGQNYQQQYANSSMFTILSYNILAQNLLESHGYLYRKHDPRALAWSHRVQRILEEIICFKAEIICLQEVQQDHLQYIAKHLTQLKYKYVYKKRTLDHTDGSAIFYKANVFSMVDYKLVEYYRPNNEILNRHNVGIVLKLKLKETQSNTTATKSDLVVATTHLLYNPRRTDVRLAQTQLMLAELDRMAYVATDKNGCVQYLPIILTGDFNLKPHTPVYDLLTKGVLQYSNLSYRHLKPLSKGDSPQGNELLSPDIGVNDNCQFVDVVQKRMKEEPQSAQATCSKNLRMRSGLLFHSLNFTSTHYHLINNSQTQASTFQNEWITVDYIFYSNGSSYKVSNTGEHLIGHLNLLSRLDLPTVPQCDFMGQIPNLVFGSDHLLLAAKFLYQR